MRKIELAIIEKYYSKLSLEEINTLTSIYTKLDQLIVDQNEGKDDDPLMMLKQEVQRIASSYTEKKTGTACDRTDSSRRKTRFHFGDHPIRQRVQPEEVILKSALFQKSLRQVYWQA